VIHPKPAARAVIAVSQDRRAVIHPKPAARAVTAAKPRKAAAPTELAVPKAQVARRASAASNLV